VSVVVTPKALGKRLVGPIAGVKGLAKKSLSRAPSVFFFFSCVSCTGRCDVSLLPGRETGHRKWRFP
jgi:hypothetical protein